MLWFLGGGGEAVAVVCVGLLYSWVLREGVSSGGGCGDSWEGGGWGSGRDSGRGVVGVGWEGGGRGREGGGGVEGGGSRGRVVVVSVVWIIRFTQSNLARFFCEFTLLPLDSRCRIVDPNPLDRSQGTRVEGARVVAVTAAEAVVVAVIVAGAMAVAVVLALAAAVVAAMAVLSSGAYSEVSYGAFSTHSSGRGASSVQGFRLAMLSKGAISMHSTETSGLPNLSLAGLSVGACSTHERGASSRLRFSMAMLYSGAFSVLRAGLNGVVGLFFPVRKRFVRRQCEGVLYALQGLLNVQPGDA